MIPFTTWLQDLSGIFYPKLCPGCFETFAATEHPVCSFCINRLPYTNFATLSDNPTEHMFVGRLQLEAAHSVFYFSKGHTIQRMMHQLKYNNQPIMGEWMGVLLGNELKLSGRFNSIDHIIALPMEKSKERKRGYNQASVIANGVAKEMKVPVLEQAIIKSKKTSSQTRKDRQQRWMNIHDSFVVMQEEPLKNKNILLIDDVITTGATIDACGNQLLRAGVGKLFVASIAIA